MHGNIKTLADIPLGNQTNVISLISDGKERRRMLDLGIISGTAIKPLYRSPSGDPTAYLLRGAVIAIRQSEAEKILVGGDEPIRVDCVKSKVGHLSPV